MERATRAMRSAPAVCELDGPTMMGPRTSKADVFMPTLSLLMLMHALGVLSKFECGRAYGVIVLSVDRTMGRIS